MENENQENKLPKKFLQSNLHTEFGEFFVSTIYRKSSAALNSDLWYYETFAWSLKDGIQDEWVADNSGAYSENNAIEQHAEVCKQLSSKGEFNKK